jgi:hypothetical protein
VVEETIFTCQALHVKSNAVDNRFSSILSSLIVGSQLVSDEKVTTVN